MSSVGRWMENVVHALPEAVTLPLLGRRLGYAAADIPSPLRVSGAPTRLLIAPANSARQGRLWAAAASQLHDVQAVNLTVTRRGGYIFDSDFAVPGAVFRHSRRWSKAHVQAIRDGVSHVLIESERPILGVSHGHDPRSEAAWFDKQGIRRAYVSHGSDLRNPDLHAETSLWSPFRDHSWQMRETLASRAAKNTRFLDEQTDHPVFVATPDLLTDAPYATWLPNVVDPDEWHTPEAPLQQKRLRVLHAPTNAYLKGSELIEPAVQKLEGAGLISYQRASGVVPSSMPALYAQTDVVLDQFRIGIYSTTALEAMAAGRLVIAFVLPEVRAAAERAAGMQLPIVDATVETLEEVLADVAVAPEKYQDRAAQGPAFIGALHDGRYSSSVLAEFLGSASH